MFLLVYLYLTVDLPPRHAIVGVLKECPYYFGYLNRMWLGVCLIYIMRLEKATVLFQILLWSNTFHRKRKLNGILCLKTVVWL